MIDYDGINSIVDDLRDQYSHSMIPELIEAMNDGSVVPCRITFYWEICDTCHGEGSHSNHLGVINPETWSDWEDEDRHAYMSGHYDQKCSLCNGSGKMRILDVDALNESASKWVKEYTDCMRDDLMCRKSEMMMGA